MATAKKTKAASAQRKTATSKEKESPDTLDKKNLLAALTAFKKGNFSTRLPMDLVGVDGKIADTFNEIIEMNESLAYELGRVGEEAGRDGDLSVRAILPAARGGWKTCITSVNGLVDSLARPVEEVSRVIGAVAKGDLDQLMSEKLEGRRLKGVFLRTATSVNTMVNRLQDFSSEVTRVAREVGTEGKLGGQAEVKGVSGIWKELTDNVNTMAGNLTEQVRNIAEVTTAVANGDLSRTIEVDARGEILELRNTINTMVGQLSSFAAEVTRVAREVGTEGKLGGQAQVQGVSGTWKELTDNVNTMAGNLTDQVRSIATVTTAVAKGDLSRKVDVEAQGEILELRNTINTMVDQLGSFAAEVTRVAREVGTEGRLGGQARVEGVTGTWRELTSNVNQMADNLTGQVRSIAEVTTAVARGDLSRKIEIDAEGEILELRNTINTMVDQLGSFAGEVTRVAREVGTEGKLGGQAAVEGVAGVWKDLTDNVNTMAGNLTEQVRNIADVTTAVANGDLSRTIDVEAQGEILELRNTINTMVGQLSAFAAEVTRVAREVGTEGKLGGQAKVEGVSGTWKELTDNVNTMAGNLTEQVRNIAEVTTAVANGDLSRTIDVEAQGEVLELRNTINTMVGQLSAFAAEVSRVARQVGIEGELGGQATVEGVAGTWRELTDNVNMMANNLTEQVRSIASVTTAVARGDLTQRIEVEAQGEILELRNTINTMVDQLSSFAAEVTRVAREVGTSGKLGGQAEVEGVTGTWKELTDNVNTMADNLTGQVRSIAEVTTAVAKGDLSRKIEINAEGEILELRNTINIMVDQLSAFAAEVTRVAREVGTEGKLGGQAEVAGVAGVWKDLTDNVNTMGNNLTEQVRSIAKVTTAVAQGDLSQKITVEASGEILELRNTINTMVDQLSAFGSEVSRVARDVGTLGKLGGQAEVRGVSGIWRELTDNVNTMANNLTEQVRSIAEVTTAVADGNLSKVVDVEARGEILKLRNTINNMVGQLRAFAAEVTRVSREVGTEGKLGGQAKVEGVSGTWRELTDNVNTMANNLTEQVRNIAEVTTAVAHGDLSKQITVEARGEILQLKSTINGMVDQLSAFASEVTRMAQDVGTEGKLGGQAEVRGVAGIWKDLTDNVNAMGSNLTEQVRNIAEVTIAVANGDLSKEITVEARGEILQLKNTINGMVDQLGAFASEVTRMAQDVGTEGKLGGQARVKGVAGVWKDLTDNVNTMGGNLTEQVRGIARVVTSIAAGDLTQKLDVEARGEIADLADTINSMIDTLSTFAAQVTTVAREVGVEGKLGAQAEVPGTSGTWRILTDNVNELANNLTTQVRAIGDVATAVTQGDLTRSVTVDALGEVADLRDNINQMIITLRSTTEQNDQQNWLSGNLARFTGMLQGQRDMIQVARRIMSELAPLIHAQHSVFYSVVDDEKGTATLQLLASYGYKERKGVANRFQLGEGIVGQCALERNRILMTDVPHDYIQISSGLGEAPPLNIAALPVLFEEKVVAVLEVASFSRFGETILTFLDQLSESIGVVLNSITISGRTEELLKQSQSMSEELQTQQEELQQTNEELEEKAKQLEDQNKEVAAKNLEVETARADLQEKAEQLTLTSKYKSEFLANMSHELRSPLNSLLILAERLSTNKEGNLSDKQVEFAETIHASGSNLLSLINEILDLSKIESGTMALDIVQLPLESVQSDLQRGFEQQAEDKNIGLVFEFGEELPRTLQTDTKRLHQVLRNLLSNAFKFTEKGEVTLSCKRVSEGWNTNNELLNQAEYVMAFSVTDTGIGIPEDKQKIIFEAFQQIEGSASRKYGGTGLGLAISREIVHILGGEIRVASSPGEGSCFTVYLPQPFTSQAQRRHESSAKEVISTIDNLPQAARTFAAPQLAPAIADDRDHIQPGDRTLLIIEDDAAFAEILVGLAREKGFKALAALTGDAGLAMAVQYKPTAISLDIHLPDITGWSILDRIKRDPQLRHIPVNICSVEAEKKRGLNMGAITYVQKPAGENELRKALDRVAAFAERGSRNLLVVEDDHTQRGAIVDLIGDKDVASTAVSTAEDALVALDETNFDCVVMDLKLPEMSGFELIDTIHARFGPGAPPVVVFTAKDLTEEEETRLKRSAESIIVKGASSAERLLDETSLFLHRVEADLPAPKQKMLQAVRDADAVLKDQKVLIVDDDVRNIFALTSVLEEFQMNVSHAESGPAAIEMVRKTPDIDVILMDIMMPGMDGYEAIRRIRRFKKYKKTPIIAVTAKAMKGDREKCIEAGATDYITKPVDTAQLLSLLRVWLYD